jgi:transketolase
MELKQEKIKELSAKSHKVREHIINMSTGGGCFIGASLSCADILVYLYSEVMNITAANLDDPDRNYLFLSKGHDVPALYGTFAETGLMDAKRLNNHLKADDDIYWHPNRNIPGVEFHSGSLGHLLSVAAGVALDCKLKNGKNKILVMLGDGELNEGSVWEAFLVISAFKLDNMVLIIDRNEFQANAATESLIPLEPLDEKLKTFGLNVYKADGHDFEDMHMVFSGLQFSSQRPHVIIAKTVRGKGLPSIENRADRWFCNFTQAETASLMKELSGGSKTKIESETLIVR